MKKKHIELRETKPDYDIYLLISVFFSLMIKNPNILFIKFFFLRAKDILSSLYSLFFVMNSIVYVRMFGLIYKTNILFGGIQAIHN
jgi:hypothetical protein